MKPISALGLTLILGLVAFAVDGEPAIFHGEISDSQCALNIHSLTKSHQEMLKSKSGAAGSTPASCAVYCASYLGGKFVLSSKNNVYHLDNQEMPRVYSGLKVKVRGILDEKTQIIHVLSIEPEH